MVWRPSSCCCFTLKTGSTIIACIAMKWSILQIVYISFTLLPLEKRLSQDSDPSITNIFTAMKVVIGIAVFRIIISMMLLCGIWKNKPAFMVPYLVMTLVENILITVFFVLLVIFSLTRRHGIDPLTSLLLAVIVFLMTSCLLVVRAYYLQVKESAAGLHATEAPSAMAPPTMVSLAMAPPAMAPPAMVSLAMAPPAMAPPAMVPPTMAPSAMAPLDMV
ncbi:uncharacterized protein [Penaeus vannamei]|uniref:uncharacterized protein n=1 Tax=Penaeus vannamei TaxID=6689 RepID=UPI00387F44FE